MQNRTGFIEHLKGLSDENLVFMIQREYNKHLRMYMWSCPTCKRKFYYDDVCDSNVGYEEDIKCKCDNKSILMLDPNDKVESLYKPGFSTHDGKYNSIIFDVLYDRYKNKIFKDCKSYPEEERKYVINEITYAYFKSVMNYGRSSKNHSSFNTYMWGAIKKRHVDISRRKGWVSKNPNVTCLICGYPTGMISRGHLMNTNGKYGEGKEGYIGHSEFHKMILDKEWGVSLSDKTEKEINKFLSQKIVSEYHTMFPNCDISVSNISLECPHDEYDDYNMLSVLSVENDGVFENDDIVVYDSYVFPSDHLSFLMDNYSVLYNDGIKNKSINIVGRSYSDYEEKDMIENMLRDISGLIIEKFCNSNKGFSRKDRFYNKNGDINDSMLDMVSQALEMSLINDYSSDMICSILGHNNISPDDIRQWVKIMKNNDECVRIVEKYC